MKRNSILLLAMLLVIYSCEEALERDISNKKIILLAPANNVITNSTQHSFFWETIEGAPQYQLQVVSPRLDSIVRLVADTVVSRNSLIIDLAPGNYQWRVRGKNSAYSSAYSDVWNLTIQ